MVWLGRPYHFKIFKGCPPQNLLGPFLNTLPHIHDIYTPDQTISAQRSIVILSEGFLTLLGDIEMEYWAKLGQCTEK